MLKEESDMISHFPDEILQHILSFLGTKEAMQMSILSKRWVNLWASLPSLNFNPHDFGALNILEKKLFGAYFKRFVQAVLYRREAPFLDTFLIKFPKILDSCTCSDLVHKCVSYAMKHNARVFSMHASIPSQELIACLFAWESIEELCLQTSFWHRRMPEVIPAVVNLPRIRRIHLQDSILDSRSISRLFAGCPKLEELSLENCFGEFSFIFSQKLQYLSLQGCRSKVPPNNKTVDITSSLHGNTVESTITFYSSVVQFILKTPGASALNNPSSFMQSFIHGFDLDDNLHCLFGVTVLKLHRQNFKMLEKELQKLEEFHCLMELWLSGWCMICNFSPVALFLQKSPNIQKLVLYNCGRQCQGEKIGINQMVDNFILLKSSQCKNLTVVHIKLSKYPIRVHKVEKALLPHRKEFEKNHLEIVLSHIDGPFWV